MEMSFQEELEVKRTEEIQVAKEFIVSQLLGEDIDLSFYDKRIDILKSNIIKIEQDPEIKEREKRRELKTLNSNIDKIKRKKELAKEQLSEIKRVTKELADVCNVVGDPRDVSGSFKNAQLLDDMARVINDSKFTKTYAKETEVLKNNIRKARETLDKEIIKSEDNVKYNKVIGDIRIDSLQDLKNLDSKYDETYNKVVEILISRTVHPENTLLEMKKQELEDIPKIHFVSKNDDESRIRETANVLIPEIAAIDNIIVNYHSNLEETKDISKVKRMYEEAALAMLKSKYAEFSLTIIQDERYFAKSISLLQDIVKREKIKAEGLKNSASLEASKIGIDKQIEALKTLEELKKEFEILDSMYVGTMHSTKDELQLAQMRKRLDDLIKTKDEILQSHPEFNGYEFKITYMEPEVEKVTEESVLDLGKDWKENVEDRLYNDESLAIKRSQNYQKYMVEKMRNKELENVSFVDYLEDKNIDSTLVEFEKEREKKTQTIYAEYLRYLVAIPDKSKAMKFKEFAKRTYEIENIEEPIELENGGRTVK